MKRLWMGIVGTVARIGGAFMVGRILSVLNANTEQCIIAIGGLIICAAGFMLAGYEGAM